MLELSDVSFSYEKGYSKIEVLGEVSASFDKGSFYTIFGPSGSGKTTLLTLLGGLDIPQKGRILLDGTDIQRIGLSKLRQSHVSYVFQNYNLFGYMTALENVLVTMDISQTHKGDKKEHAKKLLFELGLTENESKRKVKKLSGGQQQRVAIARAIASGCNYILADEPTGNLDKNTSEGIIRIFEKLVRESNKCVIAVTHSDAVRKASDRAFSLENGHLEAIANE
jgi:putative ABC transport system ATP-binding protein